MSREDQQKRVVTQCVDDSAQVAVDGLVYVKKRVLSENRPECGLVLRMGWIAGGPQMMACAMGFAEIEHEQIPGSACEHRERKVRTPCCSIDQALFESEKFMRALTNKIALAHRIFAGNLPHLLLKRGGPTGEWVQHLVLAPIRNLKCSSIVCELRLGHVDQCDTVALLYNGVPDRIN
jgi:hypothetical protein